VVTKDAASGYTRESFAAWPERPGATKNRRTMKTSLLLRNSILAALLVGCAHPGLAQNYLFEHVAPGTQPYQALLGDTEITDFDLAGEYNLTGVDGEVIRLFDKSYTLGLGTSLVISSDGFLRVDDQNTMALLNGAFVDLYTFDASSRYSYRLYGDAGNHILAVQYSNLRLATGLGGNSMSMQIWLHQSTGLIEVRYGPRTENLANGYTLNRGPKMGIYHTPVDMSGCLEKIWVTGDPQAPVVNYDANYIFTGMNGVPPEGTIYRYMPTFEISVGEINAAAAPSIRNNPATDQLFVTVQEPAGTSLFIQDMAGRTLRTERATTGENVIDVSGLSTGAYLLVAQDRGTRQAQRFVKQ